MTLRIKNVQYFDWELSSELMDLLHKDRDNATPTQNLIDEFFNPDDVSVDQISDDYYELEEEL